MGASDLSFWHSSPHRFTKAYFSSAGIDGERTQGITPDFWALVRTTTVFLVHFTQENTRLLYDVCSHALLQEKKSASLDSVGGRVRYLAHLYGVRGGLTFFDVGATPHTSFAHMG